MRNPKQRNSLMAEVSQKWAMVEAWILAGILFLVPSNLFFKFWTESAYVHGLLVDYLIPKLYASDLLIIAFCVVAVMQKNVRMKLLRAFQKIIGGEKVSSVFLILCFTFVVRQFLSSYPI